MSYPDEYEAQVEAMIADLAEADAIPPSVKLLNDAARKHVLAGGLSNTFVADAILKERHP